MKCVSLLCVLTVLLPTPLVGQNRVGNIATLGRLEIRATSFGPFAPNPKRPGKKQARPGHHFVAVMLKVRNVGTRRADIGLVPVMKVDAGFEYDAEIYVDLKEPRTASLLPTEESEGGFVFEIKDGTKPIALTVTERPLSLGPPSAKSIEENVARALNPRSIHISLKGIPEKSQPAS